MSTDLLERTDERTTTTGDGEPRFSHYYAKKDIAKCVATGAKITALCGHVGRPNRDGEKYPACQVCVEIWKGLERD